MRIHGVYSIGYWADTKTYTQTHVHLLGKPVCGCRVSKKKIYQWCVHAETLCQLQKMQSRALSEHYKDYIECEHCKKWLKRKLINVI